MERDWLIIPHRFIVDISTHALTWSATAVLGLNVNTVSEISTHALTWSATAATLENLGLAKISTHALTWSATSFRVHWKHCDGRFQLTRSRGARLTSSLGKIMYPDFNSRAHVERDRTMPCTVATAAKFQLTRSRGARHTTQRAAYLLWVISTHALTWSATRFLYQRAPYNVISTHALTWSATQSTA